MPACPRLLPLPTRSMRIAGLGSSVMATLAVYAMNSDNQGAGWSNLATVSLLEVGPPPHLLTATSMAPGVDLRWQLPANGPRNRIVVYRQLGQQAAVQLAVLDASASQFLDTGVHWGESYDYWLRSASGEGAEVAESEDSNHLQVTPLDIFAPSPPEGLAVVRDLSGVDLSWQPMSEVRGYNVYRRDSTSATWKKLNPSVLPTPVFHDAGEVTSDTQFAVTAVGTNGRESGFSPSVRPGDGSANLSTDGAHLSIGHGAMLFEFIVSDQYCNFL